MRSHTYLSNRGLRESPAIRLLAVMLLWLVAMVASGFGPPTLIESESATAPVSPGMLRLMRADEPPELTSRAVAIMDAASGRVVYEENSRARRAPASTTKMMTALVTLENSELDEVVTAGDEVLEVEPSIIGLEPGDSLTIEQLLFGLLLPSGNDAALALAVHVGGSVESFVAMMNEKAAQLGMRDTHFANPHGLDAEGHYSTARDLAVLARVALQNPVFERTVGTSEYTIDGPVNWVFRSTNELLRSYPGADGVKTGYTDAAGRCLVSSATREGRRAIAVTLDSSDVWAQSSALLDYFFTNFVSVPLSVPDLPLSGHASDQPVTPATDEGDSSVTLPVWQMPYLRWYISSVDGPYTEGSSIGRVEYRVLGEEVGGFDLRIGDPR